MGQAEDMRTDFEKILLDKGTSLTIKYPSVFSYSGTEYDEVYLSGATVISGLGFKQPISTGDKGDVLFLEQGKIELSDDKLFVHGSLTVTTDSIITYGGSPGSLFEITGAGVLSHEISGISIYKKIYVRPLYGSGAWYG